MWERLLRRGSEHKDASRVVDEAFENGDLATLDGIKEKKPPFDHPSVQDSYFGRILKIASIGLGVATLTVAAYKAHEDSVKRAQEEFAAMFKDPLAVPLKRTRQAGETAIDAGLGEQFVHNLCTSSISHPNEAKEFWGSLNPYHPIFVELLDPETRHPRHLKPLIQPKYSEMIEAMIGEINKDPENVNPQIGKEIDKAIKEKIKRRSSQ